MRRECQEIVPGMLLGPFVVSKQLDKLEELGITHMCVMHFRYHVTHT
jgi:serine/threonine/tyrosine-interacting protein